MNIKGASATAIRNIGSAEATPFFVRILENETTAFQRTITVRDIANLHERGRSAGPAVLPYLEHSDWDLRVAAARALGYIGYSPAADGLIKLLDCEEDWRVVLSAVESLARLNAHKALPKLAVISRSHWYPPVRRMAARAVKSLKSGAPFKSGFENENFPTEFFGYEELESKMEYVKSDEANLIDSHRTSSD